MSDERAVSVVGAVAGALLALWSIWFTVAFAPWISGLGEWRGIEAYAAVLGANYFLPATVVRDALVAGATDSPAWFVIGRPYSITGMLEGAGYGFMGLAVLFAGLAIVGGRLATWVTRCRAPPRSSRPARRSRPG